MANGGHRWPLPLWVKPGDTKQVEQNNGNNGVQNTQGGLKQTQQ
jgi:hypothetical protein